MLRPVLDDASPLQLREAGERHEKELLNDDLTMNEDVKRYKYETKRPS